MQAAVDSDMIGIVKFLNPLRLLRWWADIRLGKWPGFAVGQDFERVQRRIQKLGDYCGGASSIAKVCQEYRQVKISVIEVSLNTGIDISYSQ